MASTCAHGSARRLGLLVSHIPVWDMARDFVLLAEQKYAEVRQGGLGMVVVMGYGVGALVGGPKGWGLTRWGAMPLRPATPIHCSTCMLCPIHLHAG